MARGNSIKVLRTTRANLDAQKAANGLIAGEPYLITDEGRIAVATAADAYQTAAKQSEIISPVFQQYRLTKDGTDLKLIPFNGNLITDGLGYVLTVPSSGLTLAPTGLTPGTAGYIYAKRVSLSLDSLVFDATAPIRTSNGVWIKNGASDHILVGYAAPDTGPAWVYSDTKRWVRSWANEPAVSLKAGLGSNTTISNSSYDKISSSMDLSVLLFQDEQLFVALSGFGWSVSTAATFSFGPSIDSTIAPLVRGEVTPATASSSHAVAPSGVSGALSAGLHTVSALARTAGSAAFSSSTVISAIVLRGN